MLFLFAAVPSAGMANDRKIDLLMDGMAGANPGIGFRAGKNK